MEMAMVTTGTTSVQKKDYLGWPNVGVASHWPCITDNSGITTYGLMALEREMSTPPIPSNSMVHFTFTFTKCGTLNYRCRYVVRRRRRYYDEFFMLYIPMYGDDEAEDSEWRPSTHPQEGRTLEDIGRSCPCCDLSNP